MHANAVPPNVKRIAYGTRGTGFSLYIKQLNKWALTPEAHKPCFA